MDSPSPIRQMPKKDARDAKLDIEDYLNLHGSDLGDELPMQDLENVRKSIERIRSSVDVQN